MIRSMRLKRMANTLRTNATSRAGQLKEGNIVPPPPPATPNRTILFGEVVAISPYLPNAFSLSVAHFSSTAGLIHFQIWRKYAILIDCTIWAIADGCPAQVLRPVQWRKSTVPTVPVPYPHSFIGKKSGNGNRIRNRARARARVWMSAETNLVIVSIARYTTPPRVEGRIPRLGMVLSPLAKGMRRWVVLGLCWWSLWLCWPR